MHVCLINISHNNYINLFCHKDRTGLHGCTQKVNPMLVLPYAIIDKVHNNYYYYNFCVCVCMCLYMCMYMCVWGGGGGGGLSICPCWIV